MVGSQSEEIKMKKILFVILGTLLISCTNSNPQALHLPATSTPMIAEVQVPPYLVVKAMYSALNNGDIERAMSFFSDEAVYIVRKGPEQGIYLGKAEIRPLLEPEIKNKITSVMSDLEFATNVVALEHRRIQDAEAVSSEIQVFAVLGGKITGVGVDPESLIRFMANALNQGLVDRALSLFIDKPVCMFASSELLTGRLEIKSIFQEYVDAGDIFEISDVDATEYYKVFWTLKIYSPRGKVIAEARRLSQVESGRIEDCLLPE
jgi:SnoaL-like protein